MLTTLQLIGQVLGALMCKFIKRSRWILIGGCTFLLAFCGGMVSVNPGQEAKGVGLMFMACFSVGVVETCSLALGKPPNRHPHFRETHD